jgi:hypothetical protein
LADVHAILGERHRIGGVTVDLSTATFDLNVPCLRGAGLWFAVQTANQPERQARTLPRGEAKDVCKNVGRTHAKDSTHIRRFVPRLRSS